MLPTEATTGDGDLPPPPAPAPTSRSLSRSAKWSLAGLSVVGLSYVAIVDPNRPNLVPACAFRAITGVDCPGCGGTRAVHALLHGDIGSALNHNALATVVILVGLLLLVVDLVLKRLGREPLRFSITPRWAVVAVVVVGAFWILRNLPVFPFSWLGSGN